MARPEHIVLITTTLLSANPRLLKEAWALSGQGYRVTVVCCFTKQWAYEADREILTQAPFKALLVGGTPHQNTLCWHFGRFRRKVCSWFPLLPPCRRRMHAQAYDEMLAAAVCLDADLYIAHNPGALAVAARAAKKRRIPFAFDAEDFHRGESVIAGQNRNMKILEDRYLPDASYITAASTLITHEYARLFPEKKVVTINNVFCRAIQPAFRTQDSADVLKLFWFSQTVGRDRGIQEAIHAMNLLPELNLELTILGYCKEEIKSFFLDQRKVDKHSLNFIDPVQPDAIFRLASGHDIGLALEPAFSKNNDIALSNKIFTYLLSGNVILASETTMQNKFMKSHPCIGRTHPIGDVKALATNLNFFYLNRQALNEARQSAWKLANQHLNWEEEQKILIRLVEDTLARKAM